MKLFSIYKNKESKNGVIYSGILLLLGIVFLLNKFINLSFEVMFMIFLGVYGIVSLLKFFTYKDKKDYSNIYSFAVSLVLLIASLISKMDGFNKIIYLFIFSLVIALVKLKKADFYHDRKSKVWSIEVLSLIVFLINSFICGVNLLYYNNALVFAYYVFILSIIEISDALIINISKGKLK